jgi:hypothetical protein
MGWITAIRKRELVTKRDQFLIGAARMSPGLCSSRPWVRLEVLKNFPGEKPCHAKAQRRKEDRSTDEVSSEVPKV